MNTTTTGSGPDQDADLLVRIETTFPSRNAAEACADRLVAKRLAACVQVEGPVESRYRWQGSVERAQEWRCVCKTAPAVADACRAAIEQLHPYQTPELIVARVTAAPAYAAWVRESVATGGGGVSPP